MMDGGSSVCMLLMWLKHCFVDPQYHKNTFIRGVICQDFSWFQDFLWPKFLQFYWFSVRFCVFLAQIYAIFQDFYYFQDFSWKANYTHDSYVPWSGEVIGKKKLKISRVHWKTLHTASAAFECVIAHLSIDSWLINFLSGYFYFSSCLITF